MGYACLTNQAVPVLLYIMGSGYTYVPITCILKYFYSLSTAISRSPVYNIIRLQMTFDRGNY